MDKKKNSVMTIGIKLSTAPKPVNTPSIINECMTGFSSYAVNTLPTALLMPSIAHTNRSLNRVPMTPNVSTNTVNMIPRNAGIASTLCVSMLSIHTLR
jgi:hypothetical protein